MSATRRIRMEHLGRKEDRGQKTEVSGQYAALGTGCPARRPLKPSVSPACFLSSVFCLLTSVLCPLSSVLCSLSRLPENVVLAVIVVDAGQHKEQVRQPVQINDHVWVDRL